MYFLRGESGEVLETVVIAHNLSSHCPGGCSTTTLGTPPAGDEMRLLKLIFEGVVELGEFQQGTKFIQASIEVGQPGCGVPGQVSPDGEVIDEGHPPGYRRYEASQGEVKILGVSGAPTSVTAVEAELRVDFEVGEAVGSLHADHCAVLDHEVVE
jgi:hypothetical protein